MFFLSPYVQKCYIDISPEIVGQITFGVIGSPLHKTITILKNRIKVLEIRYLKQLNILHEDNNQTNDSLLWLFILANKETP